VLNWGDDALRQRMRKGWSGGLYDGTPCGSGSTMTATVGIRAELPALAERHGIRSICDAGAGDLHWVRSIDWKVAYRPFDLVPRCTGVEQLDITQDQLPACDAILCRHVLIHLDPPRITIAIDLFRKSARFLLASQYDVAAPFNPADQFNRTDLRGLLGEPVERLKDVYDSELALWRL
jgi:hypothetical protein